MKFNARKIKYEIVEMKVGFVSQVKMCSSVECERGEERRGEERRGEAIVGV